MEGIVRLNNERAAGRPVTPRQGRGAVISGHGRSRTQGTPGLYRTRLTSPAGRPDVCVLFPSSIVKMNLPAPSRAARPADWDLIAIYSMGNG